MSANLLTYVLLGDAVVIGAVVFFVVRGRRRRAREEAAVAAAEAAAAEALAAAEAAAAAASDPWDNDATFPIAMHPAALAAAAAAQAEILKLVQEMTSPPPYLAKSPPHKVAERRRARPQPHHDMSQPGTPAQRLNDGRGYDQEVAQ
jgi:hypothetical protein